MTMRFISAKIRNYFLKTCFGGFHVLPKQENPSRDAGIFKNQKPKFMKPLIYSTGL